jgi:ribonuclease HI
MENYYVVKKGYQPGIYKTWLECKKAVEGFKSPIYKKFSSFDEANTFFKSELKNSTLSIFKDKSKDTSKDTNKISLGNSLSLISAEEMQKIKEMSKNIKSSPYSDELNYNINGWNCITDNENANANALSDIYIFTDGSARKSKGNAEYYNSGVGVYLGYQCINIKEQYNNKTNNQCELMAMDYAFKLIVRYHREISEIGKVVKIVSDSEYSIKACSIWLNQWKKNNWITSGGEPVKNRELIESIDSSMSRIKLINSKIEAIIDSKIDSKADTVSRYKKIIVKLIHVNSHQTPDLQDKFKFNIWFGNYVADCLAQNTI